MEITKKTLAETLLSLAGHECNIAYYDKKIRAFEQPAFMLGARAVIQNLIEIFADGKKDKTLDILADDLASNPCPTI